MDGRLATARDLADRARDLATARNALADAQRAYGDAFKAARKAGWDSKELTTHLGLEEPERAPRRRSPRTRVKPAEQDTGAASGDSEPASS